MEEKQLDLFDNFSLGNSIYSEFPNDEYSELEYKSAAGGFPRSVLETYSAFANTEGGFIILGVSEKKGNFFFDGLDEKTIKSRIQEFWSLLNNQNKVSRNICSNSDVKIAQFEERNFLIIRVPAARRTDKPIFLNNNPLANTFKRNNEGDYRCTSNEVKRLLADADLTNHHDNRILSGYSKADIDDDSLRGYRQMFATAKPGHPWLAMGDFELIKMLGGYRKDRETGKEGYTVAGLLMFGKTSSIIDPECAPFFFPDYQEILSADGDTRWTDRIFPDGSWEANLFQFYLKVWPKLLGAVPKKFHLQNSQRLDDSTVHTALREAFVNSMIHADYTCSGSLKVQHKKDKLSFTNPGTLLLTLYQYYHGGISECRNPIIQMMFLNIGIAERMGSGVSKIIAGWRDNHWRTPRLTVESSPDRVLLELPMINLLDRDTVNELKNIYGDLEYFSTNELMTLAMCLEEGDVNNARLQFVLDLHSSDITKMLQELSKKSFILQDGKGRGSTYHINKSFKEELNNLIVLVDPDIKSESNDDSERKGYSDSKDYSDSKSSSRENYANNNSATTELPNAKRLDKSTLDDLIVKFCTNEYRTLDEITSHINRQKSYVRNTVLPRILLSGRIQRKYKAVTNTKQAYIATGVASKMDIDKS